MPKIQKTLSVAPCVAPCVTLIVCLLALGAFSCAYHPGSADSKPPSGSASAPTPTQTGVGTVSPKEPGAADQSGSIGQGNNEGPAGPGSTTRPGVSPDTGESPPQSGGNGSTAPSTPGATPTPIPVPPPIPRGLLRIQMRNRPAIELQVAKVGTNYQPAGPVQLPAFAPDRISLVAAFESMELAGSAATRVTARLKAHDLASRCELQSKINASGWDETKARYLASIEITGLACVTRLTSEFTINIHVLGAIAQTPMSLELVGSSALSAIDTAKQIEIELPFRRDVSPGPLSVQWVSGTGSAVAQELDYEPELRHFRALRVLTLPEVSQDQATLRWVLPTEVATPLLTPSSGVGLELEVESVPFTRLRLEAFRSKAQESGEVTEIEMDLTGLEGLLPSSRERLGSLKLHLGEALVEVPLLIQGLRISEIRWSATVDAHEGQPERVWQETREPRHGIGTPGILTSGAASLPHAREERTDPSLGSLPTSAAQDLNNDHLECDPVTLPALAPRKATVRLKLGAYAKFLKGFAVDLDLTKLGTGAHRTLAVSRTWIVPVGMGGAVGTVGPVGSIGSIGSVGPGGPGSNEEQTPGYELWAEFHGLSEHFSPTQSEEALLTLRLRDATRRIVEVSTLFRTPPDARTVGLEWVEYTKLTESERDDIAGEIPTYLLSESRSAGLYKGLRFQNQSRFATHLTIPSRWVSEAQALFEKGAPVRRELISYLRRWRWHLKREVDVFTATAGDKSSSEFASWLVAPVTYREVVLKAAGGVEAGDKAWLGIFASAKADAMEGGAMPPSLWPMEALEGMQRFAPRASDPGVRLQGIVDVNLALLTQRLGGEHKRVAAALGLDHEYTLMIEDCMACVARDFVACTSCYEGVYRDPAQWGDGLGIPEAWLSERNFRAVSGEEQKLGSWQIYRNLELGIGAFPGVVARWKQGEEGRVVR